MFSRTNFAALAWNQFQESRPVHRQRDVRSSGLVHGNAIDVYAPSYVETDRPGHRFFNHLEVRLGLVGQF